MNKISDAETKRKQLKHDIDKAKEIVKDAQTGVLLIILEITAAELSKHGGPDLDYTQDEVIGMGISSFMNGFRAE